LYGYLQHVFNVVPRGMWVQGINGRRANAVRASDHAR
jgi:hypothetical protein